MSHYFISDLHLDKSRPQTTDVFIKFLGEIKDHTKSLYILGDFIEYWVGDDDDRHGLNAALEALKNLAESGCPVFIMHGNRDFLIGEAFCKQYSLQLLPDPYKICIDNVDITLSHGDLLCTDDQDYAQFRTLVRSAKWQEEFLAQTLQERIEVANNLRLQSKEAMQAKSMDLMDVNTESVKNFFAEQNVQIMIHGHTHRPQIHQHLVNEQHCQRIVLSDWHEKATYLKVEDGQAELFTDTALLSTSLLSFMG